MPLMLAKMMLDGTVEFETPDNSDSEFLRCFWQQGDAELNTKDAFAKRMALRTNPLVVDGLHNFWIAALSSEQMSDKMADVLHKKGYDDDATAVSCAARGLGHE